MNGSKHAPRLTVTARRRIIFAVIALAVAELAIEVRVIHHVTAAGIAVPALGIVSGLVYLRSTRRRS